MHLPLFLQLDGASCLVVGGGNVALRKARALAESGANVTVVAPRVADGFSRLAHAEVSLRPFDDADIAGRLLVVAATDDAETNRRVSTLCRARGILVNVVDEPSLCSFIFPAVAQKGPMAVAVSSGGACPAAAQIVRDRAAALLTDEFVREVARLGERRDALKAAYPDASARREECRRRLLECNG